ncbi:MFS transporter [Streptomyces sp. NPDC087866]|uniref:MFS transporter n=1 Tax=unclassified Streptomyces TaxID=2593676 RepID=UPI0033ADED81
MTEQAADRTDGERATSRTDLTAAAAPPGRTAPPSAGQRRTRWLLSGYFAGQGVIMATWATRLPAVKEAVGLTPGALSLALLAASAGMISMLPVGGRVAERARGTGRLMLGAAVVLGATLIVLGQVRSFGSLVVAATVFGAGQGLLNVPLNVASVACQTAYGRPIMSTLHACYSLGAVTTAGIATATASLSHALVYTVVGVAVVTAALAAAPLILSLTVADGPAPGAEPAAHHRRTVWIIGLMVTGGLIAEGTALDWSAVYVRSLGSSPTTAAAAYFLYGGGMAAGRLLGDTLTARIGPAALLRTGTLLAATGLGAGIAAGSGPVAVPAALAGWGLLGLGLAPVLPLLFSSAGTHGPRALASVSTIGNVGMLGGPAVVGALATATSLPLALTLPVLLAATLAACSGAAVRGRG